MPMPARAKHVHLRDRLSVKVPSRKTGDARSHLDEAFAVAEKATFVVPARPPCRDSPCHGLCLRVRKDSRLWERLPHREHHTGDIADGKDVLEARLAGLAVDLDPASGSCESGLLHDSRWHMRRDDGKHVVGDFVPTLKLQALVCDIHP